MPTPCELPDFFCHYDEKSNGSFRSLSNLSLLDAGPVLERIHSAGVQCPAGCYTLQDVSSELCLRRVEFMPDSLSDRRNVKG
jgi:hypothetical protein